MSEASVWLVVGLALALIAIFPLPAIIATIRQAEKLLPIVAVNALALVVFPLWFLALFMAITDLSRQAARGYSPPPYRIEDSFPLLRRTNLP